MVEWGGAGQGRAGWGRAGILFEYAPLQGRAGTYQSRCKGASFTVSFMMTTLQTCQPAIAKSTAMPMNVLSVLHAVP